MPMLGIQFDKALADNHHNGHVLQKLGYTHAAIGKMAIVGSSKCQRMAIVGPAASRKNRGVRLLFGICVTGMVMSIIPKKAFNRGAKEFL